MRALTFDFSRASSACFVSAGDSAPATTCAAKTMRLPSASHFGLETEVGMSVTRSASPPSSGSTYSCAAASASRRDTNARRRPSGLQAGAPSEALLVVSRRAGPPPAGITQMSALPRFSSMS